MKIESSVDYFNFMLIFSCINRFKKNKRTEKGKFERFLKIEISQLN